MTGIQHGGGLTAAIGRYGGAPSDWLDLSTGINPNMPALPEIPAEVWNRLPDAGLVAEARAAARDFYLGASPAASPSVLPDISPSRGEIGQRSDTCLKLPSNANSSTPDTCKAVLHPISPLEGEMSGRTEGGALDARAEVHAPDYLPLPIPGTQSLIQILPRLVPQGRPVAIVSPTYGEYAHCFLQAGFKVDPIRSIEDLTEQHGTLVVVNPNNPDGRSYAPGTLLDLHARMHSRGGHLHVDEAFADARTDLSSARIASERTGLTVSRSFGKFFGMAGLRLGFVFAEPSMLGRIDAELGPWAVSGPALYVARDLMRRDRAALLCRILERRTALEAVLSSARLTIAGGTELFALVTLENAAGLFEHLASSHILVRKFDYAPQWLRIGLSPDKQGDKRLAEALASF